MLDRGPLFGIVVNLERLKEWFPNHFGAKSHQATHSTPLVTALTSMNKKHQGLTVVELYSQRYYAERVKATVDKAMEGKKLTSGERLSISQRMTAEAFDQESQMLKNEIFAELACICMEKAEQKDVGRAPSPEQMQDAINGLPALVQQFFGEVSRTTGWYGSATFGSLHPREGG
ncbi:hypothetical protein A0H81_05901 [Grifola frondosa]|uniref:Uncharacterized protein n=1 Tax=Grifola frondosa TaxID=5627 RepID=A0A1C7MAN0_GRIFR|nr:hypothetical protein A0H81_05901 [Grifola frondosa]